MIQKTIAAIIPINNHFPANQSAIGNPVSLEIKIIAILFGATGQGHT
jgi:hypothetical protein